MADDPNLSSLQSKIKLLGTIRLVLLGASLALLVVMLKNIDLGLPGGTVIWWAIALGGSVVARLYRGTLLNKYNASKGGPMV